jgi:hypothetical protein
MRPTPASGCRSASNVGAQRAQRFEKARTLRAFSVSAASRRPGADVSSRRDTDFTGRVGRGRLAGDGLAGALRQTDIWARLDQTAGRGLPYLGSPASDPLWRRARQDGPPSCVASPRVFRRSGPRTGFTASVCSSVDRSEVLPCAAIAHHSPGDTRPRRIARKLRPPRRRQSGAELRSGGGLLLATAVASVTGT